MASSQRRAREWDLVAVVALGGAVGGAARWLLGQALPHSGTAFPWATFCENVTGCLLIGALMALLLDAADRGAGWGASRYARPFGAVGVLGGFTTFSAYMVESTGLLREGAAWTAGAYLAGSLVVGLLAVQVGLGVAERLVVRPRRRRSGSGAGAAERPPEWTDE